MHQPVHEWLVLIFPLYALVWVCGVINDLMFRSFFRKKHPEIARDVFPTIFNKSINSDLRRWRYVWKREYATVPEPEFVRRCDTSRFIEISCFAGIALGLVLIGVMLSMAKMIG